MWTKPKSLLLSVVVVRIVLALLFISLFLIPLLINYYLNYTGKLDTLYLPLLIILYASAIPAFITLFSLDKLLRNLGKNIIFEEINTKLLRIISWCCFSICLMFFAHGFYFTISFFISFAAGFISIILRVLKNVFEHAVEIKHENDFTI